MLCPDGQYQEFTDKNSRKILHLPVWKKPFMQYLCCLPHRTSFLLINDPALATKEKKKKKNPNTTTTTKRQPKAGKKRSRAKRKLWKYKMLVFIGPSFYRKKKDTYRNKVS